jgi:hypothetical protein
VKPASEWDLNHILQLPLGEFDWVEFKGRKSLDVSAPGADENKVLDELARQLSAFANSGGGSLVYGISNPTNGTPRSVDDGGIKLSAKRPNIREWLEDIVPNLVEFTLKKFNVYALTNKAGAPGLADDRCIILVDIPDSDDAPHQSTREHRYFARVGGKSRPIGHRLVADIFHRRQHPLFNVEFSLRSETWVPQADPPVAILQAKMKPRREVTLTVRAQNRGKVYAEHLHLTLWIPEVLLPWRYRYENLSELNGARYLIQKYDNRRRDEIGSGGPFGLKRYGGSWLDPVLPDEARSWNFKCMHKLRPEDIKADCKLRWALGCDNAPSMSEEVQLQDIQFTVEDEHSADELDADQLD